MGRRIISSVIFTVILVLIMFVVNSIVDSAIIVLLSLIGIYEYNKAFKNAGYKPISWVGYLACFVIFTMGGIISDENKLLLIKIAVPTVLIVIFMYVIITNLKRSIIDIAITVFSLIYIPFMFSFVKLILMMPLGRVLIWFVFLGAFASDVSAYFIGTKFGKTKLCPDISPKKTVEGSIGGIIGVVLSYAVLTYIANRYFGMTLQYGYTLMAGVIAGIAGQFGDLSASAIKRYCNVKDFGNLIPGHGGILDRFDSILFVAPVIYMFLKIYILV